jgi:hypothetical protein
MLISSVGGEGGIRTPDAGITDVTVFETAAFNHSATSPPVSLSTHPQPFNRPAVPRHNAVSRAQEPCFFRLCDTSIGACITGRPVVEGFSTPFGWRKVCW